MSDQAPDKVDVGHPGHRVPAHLLQRMGRLVRKEVSTILRDRRTIITLVLMPVLLYPLLTIAFRQFFLASNLKETKEPDYRLGMRAPPKQRTRAEQAFVAQLLEGHKLLAQGEKRLPRRRGAVPPDRKAENLLRFTEYITVNVEEALRKNDIDLGVRVEEGLLPRGAEFDGCYICTLFYLEGSPRSRDAKELVERCLAAANNQSLVRQLIHQPVRGGPVQLVDPRSEPVAETKTKETIPLSALVPLI